MIMGIYISTHSCVRQLSQVLQEVSEVYDTKKIYMIIIETSNDVYISINCQMRRRE